ncbi:hypothetical protein [Plantactinospora sp. KBS50]|uniref:hypothetical protein n=1 Tax=Plantactinospora sp. KBS50 TaxID=2024580 RepID=UPI000BAACA84|nr:hypothetical protein [Plantactinospora sp. KBS50]ASW56298.1 hypothetical protein CIK06_22285 [Plantactinospora sp. KBS50]
MSPDSRRVAAVRIIGNVALAAGLLVSVITLSSDSGTAEPHILAGLLVATGIGLRIEAAISSPRA